jgi:pimeloyl-ACP methyl ester carboxylesterase
MSQLTAGGHRLDYQWLGPQPTEAPTIVFLHEGLGCVEMWRDFPQRVADATGYGVLIYSRAGYGRSEKVELPRSVRFMHDEGLITLPEVLQELDIKNAILFGHSDGGSISLINAGGVNTGIVRALVLEAPHVFVEDFGLKSIRAAATEYEKGDLRRKLERYHGNNVECAFRGWNDVWLNPDFRNWNIEEYLPQISVPVLVIQGENDQYGTWSQVDAIENSCTGEVRSVKLSDCGHSPHRDQPERTLDATVAFLKRFQLG